MIGQSRGHRWRLAFQATVLVAEIVVGKVQRKGAFVVIPPLREAVGQPAHSLCPAADCTVVPLGMRRADFVFVRVSPDGSLLHRYYPRRRVFPLLVFGPFLKVFDYHPVVNLTAKLHRNSCLVRGVAVRRDLEAASRGIAQLLTERVCIVLCAASEVPADNQLRCPLGRYERVGIAHVADEALPVASLIFGINELPQLVALNIFDAHPLQLGFHPLFALLADDYHQVNDGVRIVAGAAGTTRYAHSFGEHLDNPRGLVQVDSHSVEPLGAVCEAFPAIEATVTLSARFRLAVFLAVFVGALRGDHRRATFRIVATVAAR